MSLEALNRVKAWADHTNNPVLQAYLAQYGDDKVFSAQELNDLRDALKYLETIIPDAFTPNNYDLSEFSNNSENPFIRKEDNKKSALFSTRKIGVINKAFRLQRSSDNTFQDVFFDSNNLISDNSLCENGQTLAVWRGVTTVRVAIWYNQSIDGAKYDLIANNGFNNIGSSTPPVYSNGIITFKNQNYMFFRNTLVLGESFRKMEIMMHQILSGSTIFRYEAWGDWLHTHFITSSAGAAGYSIAGSTWFMFNNNVNNLFNIKQDVGGSSGDDNNNISTIARINKNNILVQKERDGWAKDRIFAITGGLNNQSQVHRKELRFYNDAYSDFDFSSIENEMFNYL